MKVIAKLNNLRITPRKTRLVAYTVRGIDVTEAMLQFEKQLRKAGQPLAKLVKSAVANAEHNYGMERSNLFVAEIIVDEGQKLKRWLPRAQGRATPLWHRFSNVRVILEEKVLGQGRKAVSKPVVETEKIPTETTEVKEGQPAVTLPKKKELIMGAEKPLKKPARFGKKMFQRKSV